MSKQHKRQEEKMNPEERYLEHKKILSEDPGNIEAFSGLVEYCVKKSILSIDPKLSETYINEANAAVMPFLRNIKKEEDKDLYWNANKMIANAKRVYHLREDRANKRKYAQLAEEHGENILTHYVELKNWLRKSPKSVKMFREYVDYSLALASCATNIDQRWTYILNVNDAEDIFLEGRRESEEARRITEEACRRMNMSKQEAIKEERKQSYAEYVEMLSRQYDEAKSMLDKDPCNFEAFKQFVDSCVKLGLEQANCDEKWLYIMEAHDAWLSRPEAAEKGNDMEMMDIYAQLDALAEEEMYS